MVVVNPDHRLGRCHVGALSVIYLRRAQFEEYLDPYSEKPGSVVMDTANYFAKAPVRLLVSGANDALSTWFEAWVCSARATGMAGGQSTEAALSPPACAIRCWQGEKAWRRRPG